MTNELKTQLRLAYNEKADERNRGTVDSWKEAERAAYLALLRQEGKKTLLEIGAGPGRDSLYFQENGLTVTAVDLSPEMVRLCRQKGLQAYEMDMTQLHFPPQRFDAAYALNSLLHLPHAEWPGTLAQISSLLKPGGLFYLGVYGGYNHEGIRLDDSYEPKRFFAFYADEALQEVVTAVFDLLSFKPIAYDDGTSGLHFQACVLRKRSARKSDGEQG